MEAERRKLFFQKEVKIGRKRERDRNRSDLLLFLAIIEELDRNDDDDDGSVAAGLLRRTLFSLRFPFLYLNPSNSVPKWESPAFIIILLTSLQLQLQSCSSTVVKTVLFHFF